MPEAITTEVLLSLSKLAPVRGAELVLGGQAISGVTEAEDHGAEDEGAEGPEG